MKDKIGIGIVGSGAIAIKGALTHLRMPDALKKVQLAAICDPVPGRAEAAAKKYGILNYYETYEELLEDPNVDIVTIGSPISCHFEQGMAAIEKRKHIHFNKTMTITVEEANKIISFADSRNIKIVASPGQMIYPHNQKIRRLILEGAIGQVVWSIGGWAIGNYHLDEEIRTGDDVQHNVDPAWYFKKPHGGPQYDVTVYIISTMTGILGPAKRVTAMSGLILHERMWCKQKILCDMDDSTILLLDFGDSCFAVVYGSIFGVITDKFQPNFYGTEGEIVGTRLGDIKLKTENDNQPHVIGDHLRIPESHVYEDIMQLVDWIVDDKPSIANTAHARHIIDIIESGYRAASTGIRQDLKTTFIPLPLEYCQKM